MKIFTNVAALKLAKLTAGQLVETKGYYTAGDGGQARYLIVAPQAADEYGNHTLANSNVAVLQYEGAVNVRWFGAKGDGVTDDTVAIQACVAEHTNLYIPDGIFIINENIELQWNTTLKGSASSLLDFSQGNSTRHIQTKDVALTALPNLSSSVKAGDRNIYFSAAHGLEQGDVVVFYNPTDFSWATDRNYYRKGERAKVGKVISTTHIMLQTNLLEDYALGAATQMGKHEAVVGCTVDGLNIKARATSAATIIALTLFRCVDSQVSNVNIKSAGYICLSVSECFNVSVTNSNFEEDMEIGFGGEYGIAIGNSQNIFVTGCYAASARHGITVGGASGFGKGVNYHLLFSQCTIGTVGGSHAADMHSNTAYSGYDNCIINGTIDFSGHSNFVRNCKIIEGNTEEGNDSAIYLKCTPSMEHSIIGNTIVSTKERININRNAMIATLLREDTTKGGSLVIKDNVINWDNPLTGIITLGTVTGAEVIGATSIGVSTGAATGSIILTDGDMITIAGHSKAYTVTGNVTIGDGATGVINIESPGLVAEASGGEVISIYPFKSNDNDLYPVIGDRSVRLQNVPLDHPRNVIVEGNLFTNKGNSVGDFVYFRRSGATSGTQGLDFISIKNNKANRVIRGMYIFTSDGDATPVANEVIVSDNDFRDIQSTGIRFQNIGLLRVSNNNITDYLAVITGSSTTNSAMFCTAIDTVVEHDNFTYSSYGLDTRRVYFGTVTNLYRGQKANLGGKIDVVGTITNDVAM